MSTLMYSFIICMRPNVIYFLLKKLLNLYLYYCENECQLHTYT
jgi:hypothetical protein